MINIFLPETQDQIIRVYHVKKKPFASKSERHKIKLISLKPKDVNLLLES